MLQGGRGCRRRAPEPNRLVDREREGCGAEGRRVDAEQEVVHDRVAHEGHLEDVAAVDLSGASELGGQLREAAAHGPRQLSLRSGVEHDVGDAAHEVLAEPDLRVHLAGGCEHVARQEVAEMPGDRRRADVEGDPEGAVVQSRPDRGDRAPVVDGDGHRAVSSRSAGCSSVRT